MKKKEKTFLELQKKCAWCKMPLKKNTDLCKDCSNQRFSMNFHISIVNSFLENPVKCLDFGVFGLEENVKEVSKKIAKLKEARKRFKRKSVEKIKLDKVETVKDIGILLKEIKRLDGNWEKFFDYQSYTMIGRFYKSQDTG